MSEDLLQTFTPFVLSVSFVVLAAFFGGVLAGWTGWGGWIIAGAVVWIFFPPLVSLVAAQPVILAMDGLLAIYDRKHTDWKRVRKMLLWAVPGTLVGLWLLAVIPVHALYFLAGLLLLGALFPFVWKHTPIPLASALGGMFTTAGGWNSPPLAVGTRDLQIRSRRGTLGTVFVVLSAVALPLLLGIGTEEAMRGLVLGTALVPPALLGTWLGLRSSHLPKPWLIWRLCQTTVLVGALFLFAKAF